MFRILTRLNAIPRTKRVCFYNITRTTPLDEHDREKTLRTSYSTSIDPIPKLTLAQAIVEKFPTNVKPYLKVMRIDRPIGSWLLFWPCAWSTTMAAPPGCLPDLYYLTLFGVGAFVMRGAGCTINDLWDKDIDAKVERTKHRPLVSGDIATKNAIIFLGAQLGAGLLVLLQFNLYTQILAISSLGLVTIYPLMKRITHWPQLVLGLTLNWGALVGWSAVQGSLSPACLSLYFAGVCWTVVYDTIYAHQDVADDSALGIKSTALKFGDDTKAWLSGFSTLMMSSLLAGGVVCEQTWPYYGSLAVISAHLTYQIYTLDIRNKQDCADKFVSNKYVGLLLFLGILLGNLTKKRNQNEAGSEKSENVTEIN